MTPPAAAPAPASELACIDDLDQARAALDPLRREVLARAREPVSATAVAGELGLPRQRVNYHVRALEDAGLLRRAGRRPRRGLKEQLYVATADAYVLAPSLLGPLRADEARLRDRFSAAYLLARAQRVIGDMVAVLRQAARARKRVATLTLDADLRFTSAAQRRAFTEALQQAVEDVVAKHAAPARLPDGGAATGRPFRLMLACHPAPKETTRETTRETKRGERS
jgi:DNA-binding transcriptional ArsR family regulator